MTGAVVANRLVHARDGRFDQGFAYFTSPPEPQRAAEAVDEALRFLDRSRGLRTFLYVHTLDPHSPYSPPPPFDRRFGPAPSAEHPAAEPYHYRKREDLARIVAQYDGEMPPADQEFGRFVNERGEGSLRPGQIVVFRPRRGVHGPGGHGHAIYDDWCACRCRKYPATSTRAARRP